MWIRELFERADTVTLYRGDAQRVEQYDLEKTQYSALFGIGIYLTDSPEIARDYTVTKGDGGLVYRVDTQDDQGARSPKFLIRCYLRHLMDEAGFKEASEELRKQWQHKFYMELPTHESRSEEALEAYNVRWRDESKKLIQRFLVEAKREFLHRRPGLRITKLTTGEYVFTAANRPGRVSRFEFPLQYVESTLHADRPLTDKGLEVVRRAFIRAAEKYMKKNGGEGDPAARVWDLRLLDPANRGRVKDGRYYGDETTPHTFDEFVSGFRKHGARYAWTDQYRGGKGKNPSLDEIWNGTHGGFNVFYDLELQKAFIADLMAAGYTGFAYDGGVRLAGTGARGGGGHLHHAYVFWDTEAVNRFRVGEDTVTDDEIGDLHKGIRASQIINR